MYLPYLLIALTSTLLSGLARAEDRPNILFVIADDWSFGHAGAYGCEWVETPGFDRVAAEGILFNRAYTPNAKCAPSRAIILTGRYSWELEEAGNHMALFPAKFGSWVERLASAGYRTGLTGKGWGPGFANDVDGKRRAIAGHPIGAAKAKPPGGSISNNDYAGNFAAFLDLEGGVGSVGSAAEKPWTFWLGTTEPHRGYEAGIGQRLGKKLEDIDHVPAYWPDTEVVRNDMLDYAIEVEHYDTHLARALALLDDHGLTENTLVVATSDHGMPFPRAKGQVFEHSNHIPLAIRWPAGIEGAGRTVEDFVNFTDLAPTFLAAAGIEDPAPLMQPLSGRDLAPIFASSDSGQIEPDRDHVLVGKERHDTGRPGTVGYPVRGIFKGDYLYVENFETDRWPVGNPETGYLNCDASPTKALILQMRRDGGDTTFWDLCFGRRERHMLYHVGDDPDCVSNLAGNPERAGLMAELKAQLFEELKADGDPRMSGKGEVFDNYPYSGASTDDFYERYMAGEKVKAGWVSESDFEPAPVE